LGGGAELAYACDIRVATTRASFGNPEPRLGILAGAGATYRLRELVGESVAKYVLLTCRTISAQDALRCGLVAFLVEPGQGEAEVHRLVDDMVTCSPRALAVTKAVVNAASRDPIVERLAQTALLQDSQRADRINKFLRRTEHGENAKS